MINDYLIYITLAITVTAIPGPAVVLTVKNSLKYGYKIAFANIIGNFIAMVILATLSAIGLGAIILASSTIFYILKIIGCLYLIYLGIKAWRTPYHSEENKAQDENGNQRKLISVFKEGFGVGITNPKAIAFFTALFPQFIDPSRTFIPQFLVLIFTIEGISCLVLSTYAILASLSSGFLSKKKPMTFFNRLSGTAFIGFGLALIFQD